MAVAPKKKKLSPAQVRADSAFAAAGRAAQARTRAAAIKKTGKPPPRSKAQVAASTRAAAAGRASQAAAKAARAGGRAVVPKAAKAKAAIAPKPLLVRPGSAWPTGCNDVVPTCAATAVACHLQAATGITMSDEDIVKLHELAGGATGATISNVLEAMSAHWSCFGHDRIRLLSYFRADEQFILAGMVVGLQFSHAGHAVLSVPGGMISWGQLMPWAGEPDEAWCLEWGL